MTGADYTELVADYININYSDRGISIYKEVSLGKSIIGKNRRVDIFLIEEKTKEAYAIECKYQGVKGTVDEKILYAIKDIDKLPLSGCIVYAGGGFSQGVLHLLESHPYSAYCFPSENQERSTKTRELDHLLAMNFKWWDLVIENKNTHARSMGLFKK